MFDASALGTEVLFLAVVVIIALPTRARSLAVLRTHTPYRLPALRRTPSVSVSRSRKSLHALSPLAAPTMSRPDEFSAESQDNKVVVKVGMVGDPQVCRTLTLGVTSAPASSCCSSSHSRLCRPSQVGKTSMMVKYVEGNFDEDYILTLGAYTLLLARTGLLATPSLVLARESIHDKKLRLMWFHDRWCRSQLYGEDRLGARHRDHVQHLGSRRYARVRVTERVRQRVGTHGVALVLTQGAPCSRRVFVDSPAVMVVVASRLARLEGVHQHAPARV